MVTDDRDGVIDELAPAFGLTPDEASTTPHALIGTVEQICDQLQERRERWGISYLGMSADQLDAFAPVADRLTGTSPPRHPQDRPEQRRVGTERFSTVNYRWSPYH